MSGRSPGALGRLPPARGLNALFLALLLAACSTWKAPAEVDTAALRARAVTMTKDGVRLSAAVLASQDSLAMFGDDVNASGIQPIWIEIENGRDEVLYFLRTGTDPDYFSSLEVAWPLHVPLGGAANQAVDDHFHALAFINPIPPGTTASGIVFTNPQPVRRILVVDLVGNASMIPFTVLLPVPGSIEANDPAEMQRQFVPVGSPDYQDESDLRAALERLPCCADGGAGEPLNIVLIGALEDIATAIGRRGFRQVPRDETTTFGRPPDFMLRRYAQAGAPSDRLRLWFAPMRYRGSAVIVGQSLRPIGGRFAPDADGPLIPHPAVDESRNLLIQDLFYSGGLEKLGFVDGIPPVAAGQPGRRYQTDGARAVLFFATRPLALSQVELLDWLPLLDEQVRRATDATE